MALPSGTRLGPYEIREPIGAGGMGEVYKASDTRLDRTVAVKILPEHVAASAEHRERFEREARAISGLSHPHICTLHDVGHQDGVDFLVMEYLEGETLAERLKQGAVPLEEALRHGVAIAEALGTAHRRGVVHRDLKPGNVMLTKAGAKLLDFGLAKLAPAAEDARALSTVATQAKPLTADGAVLGTFQYMAPEQLEGGSVDERTDIFAFGALLYEMLTGRRAFRGKSQASLIAAILEREPEPMTALQALAPPALERTVTRCLAKDPEARWQSATDLATELKWIAEGGHAAIAPPRKAPARTLAIFLAVAATAAVLTWAGLRSQAPPPPSTIRLVLGFPAGQQTATFGRRAFALSPDGMHFAYVASESGRRAQLHLRSLDRFEARALPGTEGATNPFFSPDGQWLGYAAAGRIHRVLLEGGLPIAVCDAERFNGASWGGDDTIVFGQSIGGLMKVASGGGSPQPITQPERARTGHISPFYVPGRNAVTFTVRSQDGYRAGVADLDAGEWRLLDELGNAANAQALPTGHLVYTQGNNVLAVPFDQKRLAPTGDPVAVLADVQIRPGSGQSLWTVSHNGTVVYRPGANVEAQLFSVERNGVASELVEERDFFHFPRLSPGGRSLAVSIHAPVGGHDLWLYDLARRTRARLTADGDNNFPVWSSDGTRLAFQSARSDGSFLVNWIDVAGSSQPQTILTSDVDVIPTSWSHDGTTLVVSTGGDIALLELGNDGIVPFIASEFDESAAALSPDDRWLAYQSDETGQNEVYVVSYPDKNLKVAVSRGGGQEPVWSSDGRELFYRSPGGERVYAVTVTKTSTIAFGEPELLFEGIYETYNGTNYDVTRDGPRFLTVREITAPGWNVIMNWFSELQRMAPVK